MNVTQYEHFVKHLPTKIHGCDEFKDNFSRPKEEQLDKKNIQLNHPQCIRYIMIDVDRTMARFAVEDTCSPKPTWTAINPKNGHAHIVYELDKPVMKASMGGTRTTVDLWLAAIIRALRTKLGGDPAYNMTLTKNPLHSAWEVIYTGEVYSMAELTDWLDLTTSPTSVYEDDPTSRNCNIFNKVRAYAYKNANRFGGYDTLMLTLLEKARGHNDLGLPESELKDIAKSIAKFCWERLHTGTTSRMFSARQAERGKKGGEASGKVRNAKKTKTLLSYVALLKKDSQAKSDTQEVIASKLGVSQQTVSLLSKVAKRVFIASKSIKIVFTKEAYQVLARGRLEGSSDAKALDITPHKPPIPSYYNRYDMELMLLMG